MRSGKAKSLCAICGDRRVPDPTSAPENLVVFHTGVFVMLATLLVAAFSSHGREYQDVATFIISSRMARKHMTNEPCG